MFADINANITPILKYAERHCNVVFYVQDGIWVGQSDFCLT